jgi:hypothetical protein
MPSLASRKGSTDWLKEQNQQPAALFHQAKKKPG